MLEWIAENTLVACGIAVLAALASLVLHRKPAASHLLWLCVLVALVAPPLPKLGFLDGRAHAQRLATHVGTSWIAGRTGVEPDHAAHTTAAAKADCEVCKALARAMSEPTNAADMQLGYAPPPLLARAAHEAAIREKTEPVPAPMKTYTDQPEEASWTPTPWTPKPRPFDWAGLGARLLVAAWLLGSVIALARLLRGYHTLRALVREAAPAEPEFLAEVATTARALGIRPPRVRMTSCVKTPFIAGGPRPTLVWPRGESLEAPGARAVLAHELAHLARRDHLAAWFEALAICALWWHPLAHLARTQTRRLSERACDAWVIWAFPNARRDYADALLAAVERLTLLPRPVPVLGAVDSDRKTLARRLIMIMNGNVARRGSRLLAIGAITLTAALAPSWANTTIESTGITFTRGDIDRSLQPLVDAAKLSRVAGTHASAKEYDQAIAAYTKLIKLRPDDAGAYHDLAMAQYHSGRYQEAAETFGKGAGVAAKQSDPWYQVGGVKLYDAQRAADAAKRAQKAAMEQVAVAEKQTAKHAEQAEKAAKLAAEHASKHATDAAEQTALAEAQIAAAREQLQKVKAELAASGIDVDIEAELADLEAEIADAVAEAHDHQAELADAQWDEAEWDAEWESFDEAFEDMGDFDFDFDFEFGGLTPVSDWYYNQACCLALAGDEDGAADALARAVEYGYDDADHAAADGDLDAIHGTDTFNKLAGRMTGLQEAAQTGENAFSEERWDDALEAFKAAVKIAPKQGHYHHLMAFAALRAGDTDLARKGWTAALGLNYNKPTMLYNLACTSSIAGQSDEALGYLAKAADAGFEDHKLMKEDPDLDNVRDDSRFDAILTGMTDTLKLQREIETAAEFEEWSTVAEKSRALFDRAPEHSWRKNWAAERAAMGLFYSERYDEAEDAFADSALEHGDLTRSLYNIACCRSLGGDQDGALDYLHAAIDTGWSDADHMQHDDDLAPLRDNPAFEKAVGRAADNEILSNFNAASWDQLYDRSTRRLEENAEDGSAHLQLGWSLIRTGRAEEAIPVFQRQAELGFAPGIAMYNVACCHAILGNKEAAFAALDDAIDAGFSQIEFIAEDPDLKNIRNDSRFKEFLKAHASKADAKVKQADETIPEPKRPKNRI